MHTVPGETKRMSYLLELGFHMMEPLCRCQELNLAYLEAISPPLVICKCFAMSVAQGGLKLMV